jgi:hypothetical protein
MDWKRSVRAQEIGRLAGLTIHLVEPGVYVQEIEGHLDADTMERSLKMAWSRPDFVHPYGVVHVIAPGVTYSPDMREFPDRPGVEPAVASAVVTDSAMHRMVLAALGIASRLKRGTRISAHSDVLEAIEAVRRERAAR